MIGFSRGIFSGGRMAGPRVNDGRARLVAFDKNAPGATTLAGTSDIRLLKGTPSLREYLNKQRQEKEKNKGSGGEPDDGMWYSPDRVVMGSDESTWEKEKDKEEYKFTKVKLGAGVPGTDGEGWHLYTPAPSKNEIVSVDKKAPLKITSVSDRHSIKLPTHPLENGMIKHDHKVIQPATLRVTGLVDRSDSINLSQMLKMYLGAKDLAAYFILDSPWKNFPKMYIQGFTSRANTQRYDVYEYTIDLSELLIATSVIDKTNVADLSSTSNKGAQSPKQ